MRLSWVSNRLMVIVVAVIANLACAPSAALAIQYPNASCPDSVRIHQIQNPSVPCHPVAPDTVRGVGGIIVGFDPIATGFDAYIQNTGGGPFTGVDFFTHSVNTKVAPYNFAIGDSIVVEFAAVAEFQNATEVLAANNSFGSPNFIVRKVSSGNTLPPFFVGTTNQLRETPTNTFAEQYEHCLVRINGPLTVVRTSLGGGLGTNGFLVIDVTNPTDSVLVDGNKLAGFPPPAVGTVLQSVQGILNQATRGYRIMLRDALDVGFPPSRVLTTTTTVGGVIARTPDAQIYLTGTSVLLTAIPDPSFYFVRWEGDLIGTENPKSVLMTQDRNVRAVFDSAGFLVATTVAGRGQILRSPDRDQYPAGTPLRLTAVPDAGFRFAGWSGDTSTQAPQLDFTVERVLNFSASFEPDPAFAPHPSASGDVPDDQGSTIFLVWTASPLESLAPAEVGSYVVQRRGVLPDTTWQDVLAVPAIGQANYFATVTTPADSVASNPAEYLYRVTLASSVDSTRWAGPTVACHSVDNLAPPAVALVQGSIASGFATLFWPAVSAPDLESYQIYRGLDAGFPVDLAHRVGATTQLGFTDQPGHFAYYRVTARDVHGNESPATLMTPVGNVSAGTPLPGKAVVLEPLPSPFSSQMSIRLGLPVPMRVRATVHDIAGRQVAVLCDSELGAAWHELRWNGATASGASAPPGIYCIDLRLGSSSRHIRRVVRMR